MEELVDAAFLRRFAQGVRAREGDADETGLAGQVARKPHRAHAAAVRRQRRIRGERVLRGFRRERHVVVELEKLHRERRVVGQHADRVIVNVQAVRRGFDGDGAGLIRDEPVKLRQRKLGAERLVEQIDAAKQLTRLTERGALAEQPRDQLELGHVVALRLSGEIHCVADEVEPCNAQPLFIDRVVIERIIALHIGHADDGVTGAQGRVPAHGECVAARGDGHLVAIGKFIIQIAAEIKFAGKQGYGCTHKRCLLQKFTLIISYHADMKHRIKYQNGSIHQKRAEKQKGSVDRP